VVFRNQPLPMHPNAMPAALAAEAAHRQGKFWEMHDKLFGDQKSLGPETYEKYAKELGLNMARWKADMDSEAVKKTIADDSQAGTAIGARGTPAFFINGRPLSGAQPFESFKAVIDQELQNADALLKKGVPPAKLYDEILKSAAPAMPTAPPRSDLGPGGVPGAAPPRQGG
jgi:predicted DsbA family dithiol-disulfide isomerase